MLKPLSEAAIAEQQKTRQHGGTPPPVLAPEVIIDNQDFGPGERGTSDALVWVLAASLSEATDSVSLLVRPRSAGSGAVSACRKQQMPCQVGRIGVAKT